MKKNLLAAILLSSSSLVYAEIIVKDPWVRATVPAQRSTGAFMQITSTSDVRLVSVRSPVANNVEIHEMTMDSNIMKMRQIQGIDLSRGKTVKLTPGNYHIMLIDLKQQVKDGEVVPVSLIFEDKDKKREIVEVKAYARPLNTTGAGQTSDHSQ